MRINGCRNTLRPAHGRREHPEVQACSVWSFPGEYRDRGVVRWNGCRVDYMLAGGTLTLDPAARPGHAPARGGLASGAAAGAAPEAQQTGTPLSADVRKSGASPAAASSAQAPEQVRLFCIWRVSPSTIPHNGSPLPGMKAV